MGKKNIFKDIKEKTAGMDLKGKLDYLWEYYRIHFLVTVFGVVLLISLATSIITSKLSDPVLRLGIISEVQTYCSDPLEAALQETFPESTGFKKPAVISVSSPANENAVMYSSVQLMALLNARELDCMICDKESLDMIRRSELPIEVTELKDCQLTELAEALHIPELYYVVFTESDRAEEARTFLYRVEILKIAG